MSRRTAAAASRRRGVGSLIESYVFEGTNGTAVGDGTSMGWSGYNGAAGRTWTNSPAAMVGSTWVQITAGTTGYFRRDGLSLSQVVLEGRVRFSSATGSVNFAQFQSATPAVLGSLQRESAGGTIRLKNAGGSTTGTSSFAVALNTNYIYQWKGMAVGTAGSLLRWYDAAGTFIGEVDGDMTAGTIAEVDYGIVLNLNAGLLLDDAALYTDFTRAAA